MKHNNFTYKELLRGGWNKTKENFSFLLIAMAIYAVVAIITFSIPFIGQIASMLLGIAALTVMLTIAHNRKPGYGDMTRSVTNFMLVLNYFLASLAYGLIVMLGFIALIIPGIYLAARFQFYVYAIVEHGNMGPIDALKKSWHMTRGIFWKLFGFSLVSMLIIVVSIIPFGLGLLFSIPTIGIAYALLYKHLAEHAYGHVEHHPPLAEQAQTAAAA